MFKPLTLELFSIFLLLSPFRVLSSLLPGDVSDGPCLSVSELWTHLYSGVDTAPVLSPGNFYCPMASKAAYRQYAEGLLGRPAESQEELDSMQLIFHCGVLFSTILNTGFPHLENPPQFSQSCASGAIPSMSNFGLGLRRGLNLDNIQAVCVGLPAVRPDGSFAWTASPSFVATMDSIVWVNKDSSILLTYRCPADGNKDFKVVSRSKTLRPDEVQLIRTKVLEMGFHEENIAFMKYD